MVDVVALAILLDIPASMLHGGLNLKQVQWRELLRRLPGMALGTILGLVLMNRLDKPWMMLALGTYVAFVGLRSLLPASEPRPVHARWALVSGSLIGRVEVMFATAGPVVLVWLQRRLNDLAGVRASVPVGEIGNIVFAAHWKRYEAYGKSLDKMVGEQSVQKLMAKITASGTAEWVRSNLARELPI